MSEVHEPKGIQFDFMTKSRGANGGKTICSLPWFSPAAELKDAQVTRILVVDDDMEIVNLLRRGLIYEGYQVTTASDGIAALKAAQQEEPDLVVLDIMMPGMDGLETCRRLRQASSGMPILMLSAKDAVADRVAGLECGADDYLVKPFAFDELLARLHSLLRRRQAREREVLRFADVSLNTITREVTRGDRVIALTLKEFDLLELFLRYPRQVLRRETIYAKVWGYDFRGESNIIEVYIRYLRAKLESDGNSKLLHTVRSMGYVLKE